MKRVEIIANVELLIELEENLKEKVPNYFYSVVPVMRGYGKKGYAFGDDVWPEHNFCCYMFLKDHEDVQVLKKICDDMQALGPQNSITIFAYRIEEIPL